MSVLECDRIIRSRGESSGTIYSPNFQLGLPSPRNVICQYYIDGLIDKQNLEKVELTIDFLDIPPSSGDK